MSNLVVNQAPSTPATPPSATSAAAAGGDSDGVRFSDTIERESSSLAGTTKEGTASTTRRVLPTAEKKTDGSADNAAALASLFLSLFPVKPSTPVTASSADAGATSSVGANANNGTQALSLQGSGTAPTLATTTNDAALATALSNATKQTALANTSTPTDGTDPNGALSQKTGLDGATVTSTPQETTLAPTGFAEALSALRAAASSAQGATHSADGTKPSATNTATTATPVAAVSLPTDGSSVTASLAPTIAGGGTPSLQTLSQNATTPSAAPPITPSGPLSDMLLTAQRLPTGTTTLSTRTSPSGTAATPSVSLTGAANDTDPSVVVGSNPILAPGIGGGASIAGMDAAALGDGFKAALDNAKDSSLPPVTTQNPGDPSLLASSFSAGAAPSAHNAAAAQSPDVPLAIGTPDWEKDLGSRINWMVQNQVQRAELQITPAHLGPLNLQIELNGSQASVSFTTPHAAVRETINNALPQLREMLEGQGLQLSGAGVHHQSAGDNTGGWQGQQPEAPRSWTRRGENIVETVPTVAPQTVQRSLVDYFA